MTFKLRPFDPILIERPSSRTAVAVGGRIEGKTYVVSVDAASFPLPTCEVGNDEFGAYAMVREVRLPLQLGFVLEVGEEVPEEDDPPDQPPGCHIRLFKDPTPAREHVARGLGLNKVNLVGFGPTAEITIYVAWTGFVDGYGCSEAKSRDEFVFDRARSDRGH